MEKIEEERLNIFVKYIQVKKEMVNNAQEILAEAERLGIKNKAPLVLCELLFNDKMCEERQINKYAKLLSSSHRVVGRMVNVVILMVIM